MNKGVEILIERMRTNPDDFSPDGKFADTSRRIREGITGEDANKMPWFTRHLLTANEWEALKIAYIEMSRDRFTQSVMKKLLKEKEEDPRKIYPQSAGFGLSTGTVGSSIVTNSNAGTFTLSTGTSTATSTTTLTPEMVKGLEQILKERINGGTF